MVERVDEQVEMLRRLLEEELDRQASPRRGCWPLLVALGGVLLAFVLLARIAFGCAAG